MSNPTTVHFPPFLKNTRKYNIHYRSTLITIMIIQLCTKTITKTKTIITYTKYDNKCRNDAIIAVTRIQNTISTISEIIQHENTTSSTPDFHLLLLQEKNTFSTHSPRIFPILFFITSSLLPFPGL